MLFVKLQGRQKVKLLLKWVTESYSEFLKADLDLVTAETSCGYFGP